MAQSGLDRLLYLACVEPAVLPALYAQLLGARVYALAPKQPALAGRIRFVMWTGADTVQVIPFFGHRSHATAVLTAETKVVELTGQQFLEYSRGAVVVLNPNLEATFRLLPEEVDMLLSTGVIGHPLSRVQPAADEMWEMLPITEGEVASLTTSLRLYFARRPEVVAAHIAHYRRDSSRDTSDYLVLVHVTRPYEDHLLAKQISAVLLEVNPGKNTDVQFLYNADDPAAAELTQHGLKFYDRSMAAFTMDPSPSSQ